MLKIFDLFRAAGGQKDRRSAIKTAQEIWKILVDQQYGIGTVGQSPALMGVRIVSNKLGNIPVARLHRPALPHAGRLASGDLVLQGLTLIASAPAAQRPAAIGG